jgi:hypothetical protein
VSVSSSGREGAIGSSIYYGVGISDSGRFVSFTSASPLVPDDTNAALDAFVYDRRLLTTIRTSVGPAGRQVKSPSWATGISGDGRWSPFWSYAGKLVNGDTNHRADAFIRGPLH